MAVIEIRGGLHSHFTPLPNEIIRDPNVSHKAVRIYAFLRSHQDGWRLNVRSVASQLRCSKTTINTAIQELEELGLVERIWDTDDNGMRKGIRYLIYDTPQRIMLAFPQETDGVPDSGTRVYQSMAYQKLGVPDFGTHKEEQFLKKNNLEEEQSPSTASVEDAPSRGFDDWYQTYPRHVGKKAAFKAWSKATTEIDEMQLLDKTRAFAQHCKQQNVETRFIPHPATWLNRGGWDDELAGEQRASANGFLEMIRRAQ